MEIEKIVKEKSKNGDYFDFGNEDIFKEEINTKVERELAKVYADVKKLDDEHKQNLMELAEQHGIPENIARDINIDLGETPEKAVEKMYVAQAKQEAKQNIATIKKYNDLKALDPTKDTYGNEFDKLSQELLADIPQQNKDELARYILRRNMVVDLLRLALKNDLSIQKEWEKKKAANPQAKGQPEKIIQNMIFRRGKNDGANALWILNEEFVHFDGYADSKLEELEIGGKKLLQEHLDISEALKAVGIDKDTYTKDRPDIFLYPEEGKCILVEFKALGVDLSKHTLQIPKYAKLIANYSRKPDFQFNQFFGFLVGETIDEVNLETDFWKKVPFGKHRICLLYTSVGKNREEERSRSMLLLLLSPYKSSTILTVSNLSVTA